MTHQWQITKLKLEPWLSSEICCKVSNVQGSVIWGFFPTGDLCVIFLVQAKEMNLCGYVVILGYKLCPPCPAQFEKLVHASDSESVSSCEEGDVQAIEQYVSV